MFKPVKTRWQAFGIHFALSALILTAIVTTMFVWWYPGIFINFGGWQGIKIVAGVDMILGPLLTLLVYNKTKKSLKWDLTAIGVIQLACLTAGTWVVYKERPLIQIKYNDTVNIVSAADFDYYKVDRTMFAAYKGSTPFVVELNATEEDLKKMESLSFALGGEPVYMRTDLYQQVSNQLKSDQCEWVNTESKHFSGKTCYNKINGIKKL